MSLHKIHEPHKSNCFSLFILGFRPFFLAAGVFAMLSMALWMAVYAFGFPLPMQGLASFHWHAHEMIYGYTLAVIAGFLLTAVENWTGAKTIQHKPLVLLFLLWAGARICFLFGTKFIILAAIFDGLFSLFLLIALLVPILRKRQWKQIGIVSKVLMLGLLNGLFYLGLFGVIDNGLHWGIYGGLFIIVALILTVGRRVIPFFIERGVNYPVQIKNPLFLDISSLVLFLCLTLSELLILDVKISSAIAAALFIITSIRLYNWHTPGIWRVTLLWGIYLSFIFINLGFLVYALLPYVAGISRSIAIHAIAVGGIGMITLSMMARVSLGHTGRNVAQPSSWIAVAQWLLLVGTVSRVILPILFPALYVHWIMTSQLLWILAFGVFTAVNFKILISPRVD